MRALTIPGPLCQRYPEFARMLTRQIGEMVKDGRGDRVWDLQPAIDHVSRMEDVRRMRNAN